ncbi:MAG: O-acetyl-ADP-ribose deacetylase [Actinomycetaceae bacterium]|nr:O-acetyl-ADP-ribose deacetylase [Actinomycetaceae bacterium]
MDISVEVADITTLDVDAIVNAANSSLMGGGGVDGAIHRAAGPELLEECKQIRANDLPDGLPTGQAVATKGYDLLARWVIHTVGPNKHAGQTDPFLLESAFRNSLDLALQMGARSVAFPAISAGVYGWDMPEVAQIAAVTIRDWIDSNGSQCATLQTVTIAVTSDEARRIFESALDSAFHS